MLRTVSLRLVLAVGPMLDRVLAATEGLDVTVAYAATVRPLDVATLRRVAQRDVLLAEPYLAGTSTHAVAEALADRPTRIGALGVRRDVEVRGYGSPTDHDRAHGLDVAGIAHAARSFFSGSSLG